MNKNERLKEYFTGKVFTRLVSCRRNCKLSFNERIVYSALIYRCKPSVGGTVARLSRATGLDRSRTIPRALAKLKQYGLALQSGREWLYVLPFSETSEWFSMREAKDDRKKFNYNWTVIPVQDEEVKLKPVDCAVWAQGVAEKGVQPNKVAGRLGVSVRTVQRSLDLIRRLGESAFVALEDAKVKDYKPKEFDWLLPTPPGKQQRPTKTEAISEVPSEVIKPEPTPKVEAVVSDVCDEIMKTVRVIDENRKECFLGASFRSPLVRANKLMAAAGMSDNQFRQFWASIVPGRYPKEEDYYNFIVTFNGDWFPELMKVHKSNPEYANNGFGFLKHRFAKR